MSPNCFKVNIPFFSRVCWYSYSLFLSRKCLRLMFMVPISCVNSAVLALDVVFRRLLDFYGVMAASRSISILIVPSIPGFVVVRADTFCVRSVIVGRFLMTFFTFFVFRGAFRSDSANYLMGKSGILGTLLSKSESYSTIAGPLDT